MDNRIDGLHIGGPNGKIGFHGVAPVVKRAGATGAALGAATYTAPGAVPADSSEIANPTTAQHNLALAALASTRTQLIALAADVAANTVLLTEIRAALVAVGLMKGAA